MSVKAGTNLGGRPPIYKNPADMESAINRYFDKCDETPDFYTVAGLALDLGLCSRVELYDYKQRPKFSSIVTKALLKIENQREHDNLTPDRTKGAQFSLRCHFGLVEPKIEQVETIKVIMVNDVPKDSLAAVLAAREGM